jgi:hypothetical protein
MKSISFQDARKLLTQGVAFEESPPVLPWFIKEVTVDDNESVVRVVARVVFSSDIDSVRSRVDHVNGADSAGHSSNDLAWAAISKSSSLQHLAAGVGWTRTNDRFLRPVRPDEGYLATLAVAVLDSKAKYRLYDFDGNILCTRTGSYAPVSW